MARTAINQWVVPSASRTAAGTTVSFLPVPYDIMVKSVCVFGIDPANIDGDTLNVIIDSSASQAGTFTTIADSTALEYNATDDTFGLATGATNGDIVTLGAAARGTLAFPGTRVAGNRYMRCREIWAGTVTAAQVQITVEFEVLNDTLDAGST